MVHLPRAVERSAKKTDYIFSEICIGYHKKCRMPAYITDAGICDDFDNTDNSAKKRVNRFSVLRAAHYCLRAGPRIFAVDRDSPL
jgi:hypothetical protein